MPFKRGQSGNPAGRPVGSRNKRTIVAEKLFSENLAPKRAAELSMKVRTALQVAHESGMRQRRLSVDRLARDCGAARLHPG